MVKLVTSLFIIVMNSTSHILPADNKGKRGIKQSEYFPVYSYCIFAKRFRYSMILFSSCMQCLTLSYCIQLKCNILKIIFFYYSCLCILQILTLEYIILQINNLKTTKHDFITKGSFGTKWRICQNKLYFTHLTSTQ